MEAWDTSSDCSSVRAVGYQRVSRKQQGGRFGLARQENDIRAFAQSRSWNYQGAYVDLGISRLVAPFERTGFSELVGGAGRQEFDVAVIENIDRLGSGREIWNAVSMLADLGVPVAVSALRVDDLYRLGRPAIEQLAARASAEVHDIRHRTQGGLQAKAEAPGAPHIGGRPPFGYRIASGPRSVSHLEIDSEEAATIATAVDLLLREGLSFATAAARLNVEGRLTRSGRPWSEANLRSRILSPTTLDAVVRFRGQHALRRDDGTPLWGESVAISLPRIVSHSDTEKLVARFRRTDPTRQPSVYPLSRRMTSPCGDMYTGADSSTLSWGYRGYRCRGRYRVGSSACTCSTLDAELVEDHVWLSVCDRLETHQTGGGGRAASVRDVLSVLGIKDVSPSMRELTDPALRRLALDMLGVTVKVAKDREVSRSGAPCIAETWHRERGIGALPRDLSDDEWTSIAPLLPQGRLDRVRRSVDAIFAKVRSGASWQMLRDAYGSTSTASHYVAKWTRDGTWEMVCDTLAEVLSAEVATVRRLPVLVVEMGALQDALAEPL